MKILKVKFANINSLGGEWEIDFEHQDFQNSSMFCIAGPTGSGKTSILDAICLGLYGRTPRQQPTGSSNEVMTNGESSCYAAVTLDVNGTRYTATWKQTRARTGTLKGYEWKLVNETTGDATTSSKSREIESTIAECIGLNYDEFTKSVMLAQGKFNEFLVSKEKDRAAVLEKLTGDSSCRKLAQAVYELYDNSQKELQRLRDQMGGITLLTEEELEQLAKDLGQAASAKESLGVQVENLQKIVDWYKTLHSCEEKLQIANNTFKNAQDAKIAFAPFEAKLSRAQDAHEVEATYEAYRQVLQGIEKNKERKKKLIYNLEEARKEKENACKASDTATAKAEEAAKAYSQNEPLWSEIENLDTRISAVKSNVSATESTCATAERKLQEQLNRLEALSLKIKNNETVLDGCEKFAAQHQADETIGESLSLLQTKAAEFKASRETVANAQKDVAGAELALEKFKEKRKGDGEKLESVNQYLARHDADKNLKELLPGLKNQFQTFAVSIDDEAKCHKSITSEVVCAEKLQNTVDGFTKSIADLKAEKEKIVQDDIPVIVAELRERLSEGCACPVCGSKDHPACNGTVEKSTENGAAALNDFAQKLKHLDGLIGNAEISKAQSETQLQTCNKNLEDLKSELVVLQEKRAGLLKELNLAVAPWGKSVSIESLAQIEKDLAAAKDIYEGKLIEKADYEKRVSESAVLEAQLQAALDGKIQNRSKALELQGELSRNLEKAFSPWFGNYRDEDVDAFLNQLQTRKKNWDENDSRKKKCESELGVDRSARQELSKNIETARQDLETATSQWKEAVEQRDILLKERHEKFGEKIVASERNQAAQTRELMSLLYKESLAGNYVVAGGDFNQTFSNIENWV
ncbi:MAG: AAA family ATPase, partial [Fibrobacter sp.]|nr:AAA family ATPase [Fibrobacter sp.]